MKRSLAPVFGLCRARVGGVASVMGVLCLLGANAAGAACPRCAEGQAARQAVYGEGFSRNLATVLLPFLIVGAVSAAVHGLGRTRPLASKTQGERS
jgi:hypothetical protein